MSTLKIEKAQGKYIVKKPLGHSTQKPLRSLPPTTTEQEDIVTAGQRKINLIWECTQGVIALMITGAVIYTVFKKIESDVLTNAFFLIVSMYFVRTNHSLIGGIGTKHGTR